MKKNKPGAGFTLIEMLIVTAILSVVSLALYVTFNNGIKIWLKVNQEIPVEEMDILFEKFASDLRNTLKMTGMYFTGEKDSLEFTTTVNSMRLGKISIGKIRYIYNDSADMVKRTVMDYSDIYEGRAGTEQVLLRHVKSLTFQCYGYDAEKMEYRWRDEWSKEDPPLAVRMEIVLKNNGQTDKFTKTVNIPISN